MTSARKKEQVVEHREKAIGAPFFNGQSVTLRALNLSLNAALMAIAKERVLIRSQIQFVNTEQRTRRQPRRSFRADIFHRPELQIFPSLGRDRLFEMLNQFRQVACRADQRLAMVGKWQRNDPR